VPLPFLSGTLKKPTECTYATHIYITYMSVCMCEVLILDKDPIRGGLHYGPRAMTKKIKSFSWSRLLAKSRDHEKSKVDF
jgi:hypothetical protein